MMSRTLLISLISLILASIVSGCSGGGLSPVEPNPDITLPIIQNTSSASGFSNIQLGGIFNVTIDPDTREVEAVENRNALFTANLTNILNKSINGMTFHVNDLVINPENVDVDIDIGVNHPFPGYPEFMGYDLRCIFMGDGSGNLETGNVVYPVHDVDQEMLTNPITGHGGPDGYTRWFNFTEFSEGTVPLFTFVPSKLSSLDFAGTATLCP